METEKAKSDTWYKKIAAGTLAFTSSPKAKSVGGYVHEARFLRPGYYARTETHQSRGPLTRKEVERLFADFISEISAQKE
jgi:hypothetical protein